MGDRVLPHSRGPQILKVLAEHGPLSIRGLEGILVPQISRAKLRDAIWRLGRRDLIAVKYDEAFPGFGRYYHIDQEPKNIAKTADILNVPTESLVRNQCRHQELIHSECCAIWTETFRRLFPGFTVLREFQFENHPLASRLLLAGQKEYELLPDLLIIGDPVARDGPVAVAVEVEKSRKWKKRIIHKLQKYTHRTLLDGIIYLCDKSQLSDRLRLIYREKILDDALRIRHYGMNFFLFGDAFWRHTNLVPPLINADLKRVCPLSWMQELVQTENDFRRDSKFQTSDNHSRMFSRISEVKSDD